MDPKNVGIVGVGTYLPDVVRTNDWWSESVVEKWTAQAAALENRPVPSGLTDGQALVLREMASLKGDTFRGAVQRHVLPEEMSPSDAEEIAAKRALEAAGISADQIGLLLCSSMVPDVLTVSNAFTLQRRLGVPRRCFVSGLETACNALLLQLMLAEQYVATGRARYALLVQSSILSRVLPYDQAFSTYFGDGASAVVVGPVPRERGILGRATFADGSQCGALVVTVPGKRWWQDGPSVASQSEKGTVFQMLIGTAEIGREAIHAALDDARLTTGDVTFLACHQGTPWFRRVVQEHAGLQRARSIDTFALTASLLGSNLPFVLDAGLRERMLVDGDIVALFASGAGTSWSGMVMRWGC